MNKKLIAVIVIILAACLAVHFYAEWEKARFDASLSEPPAPTEVQAAETETDDRHTEAGHWHGDEWHADDAHAQDDELIPSVDWQLNTQPHEAVKPEGLDTLDTDDPVAKAWAKLDELAENRFAWGGSTSPQTLGLIAQLTPTVEYFATEGDAEVVGDLLDELARLRDPRSIETLIEYQCEGNILTGDVTQALIAMGPPVIPHLVPYLDSMGEAEASTLFTDNAGTVGMHIAVKVLSQIGVQHRADLDGIVEHIILPKLEELHANDAIMYPIAMGIKQAVARLKR